MSKAVCDFAEIQIEMEGGICKNPCWVVQNYNLPIVRVDGDTIIGCSELDNFSIREAATAKRLTSNVKEESDTVDLQDF